MARYGVTSVAAADWEPGGEGLDLPFDRRRLRRRRRRPGRRAAGEGDRLPQGRGRRERGGLVQRRPPGGATTSPSGATSGCPPGRSEQGGSYEVPPGGQLSGVEGQEGGAPLPLPSRAASERRVIAHELGHAVVEGMLTPGVKQADALDKGMIARFKKAVGWYADELFDIQDPAVRKAIQEEGKKPAAAPITGPELEQPEVGRAADHELRAHGRARGLPGEPSWPTSTRPSCSRRAPRRGSRSWRRTRPGGARSSRRRGGRRRRCRPGSSRPALRRPESDAYVWEGAPYRRTRPTPRRSSERATISRWISLVPSQMRSTRSSRQNRSATLSRR